MIQFECVNCHAKYSVADKEAGRKAKCTKCGLTLEVPTADTATAPGPVPLSQNAWSAQPGAAVTSSKALVVMPMQDISIVDFQLSNILDAPAIEGIARELYALIDQQAKRKIILDFAKVKFLSSQMLGVLISLQKRAASIKGRVVLCGLRPEILKVFTITRLDQILTIVEDEKKALETLGFRG